MSDLKEFTSHVGQVYGKDFTKEEIEAAYPEYDVRILNQTTLSLAGFKPNRLRVWINNDGEVVKMITG